MADSNKTSFIKEFFKPLIIYLGIQIIFLVISVIKHRQFYSSDLGGRVLNFWEITLVIAMYSNIFMAGCIISVAVNIFIAVKSNLEIWQKVILSIFLPTNFTYLIILPFGAMYGFVYTMTFLPGLR